MSSPKSQSDRPESQESHPFWVKFLPVYAGICLGLGLLKFGNPVIFERLIHVPEGMIEFLFDPWPVSWGYILIAGLAVFGLKAARFRTSAPRWLVLMPLIWLGWQLITGFGTVGSHLTKVTLLHFAACVLWFYTGLFALGRVAERRSFLWPLIIGFAIVLWFGFEQHYGGLEATRRMFYEQPDWQSYPPDYLKRISSDRIFSSLVYPNALAGAIILFAPMLILSAWKAGERLPPLVQKLIVGFLIYGSVACLIWTSSKGGWLVALAVLLVALLHVPIPRKIKWSFLIAILVLGLTAFFIRFTPYFQKGATSVSARFDYWTAAWKTFKDNPLLGTGPGTFSIPYAKIKPPEAEMARLVHNDYLEQASDSGLIGFASYASFIWGSLGLLYLRLRRELTSLPFVVWLGLLGWSLHSGVEFLLYIPALAWPAFGFFGWLFTAAYPSEK